MSTSYAQKPPAPRRHHPASGDTQSDASDEKTRSDYRLLIVDDDPDIVLALETYFSDVGYHVESAHSGRQALDLMSDEPGFDLVLLDVVLPEMNGFEVLEKSHESGFSSPVLMMSGRGTQENLLRGFGLGASDYIIKPFEAEELRSRTDALVGRGERTQDVPERFDLGDRTLDFRDGVIRRGNSSEKVAEMELDLLRCLVINLGCVVTKRRLLRDAWHIDDDLIAYAIDPDIAIDRVDRAIHALREKLEPDPTTPRYIHTVYGLGYRLTE